MGRRGIRLILLSACAVLILAVGCSGKTLMDKTPLMGHTGNYSASARISYGELAASANILQDTPSYCTVAFESPESLKGMTFIFQQDTVDLSYKGLSFRFDPDLAPEGAVARLMVSAINRAMSDDSLEASKSDGAIYLSGTTESGGFTLTLDKESGNLTKLSIPGEELEIEFDNFRFLD